MQLFKSEWLQEPVPSRRTPIRREPAFGPRYGSRAVSQRAFGPSTAAPAPAIQAGDNVVAFEVTRERAILRALAEYDRAA